MMAIRYSGEFLSKGGVTWKVNILQEGFSGSVTELNFPADSPLVIEWSNTDKMAPVQFSNATLKVMSDTDREFIGLYTVAVGSVRMDVYRNNSLYWSGNIDTELYSEPYHMGKDYEVSLTFSDFACLERMDWTGTGFASINSIITTCLTMAGIHYSSYGVGTKFISTCKSGQQSALDLTEVYVQQENFYDEYDEGMSALEVLEAVLRPFALRIIQKNGNIYVYDLNALSALNASQVTWDGDYSELGVDKVYNNVKVTFSPYGESVLMEGTVEEDKSLTAASGGTLLKRDFRRDNSGALSSLDGFRLHYNTTLVSNMVIAATARKFQICPIYSGNAETGVIATFKKGDYSQGMGSMQDPRVTHQLMTPAACGDTVGSGSQLIKCPRVYLGFTGNRRSEYMLKLSLDLLFDVRYNPFEEADDFNEGNNIGIWQSMQDWCNFGYVPIKLYVEDAAGTILYHYENRNVEISEGFDKNTGAGWVSGAPQWNQAFLCYYDFEDRKSATGFGGWSQNKQIIGYYRDALPKNWEAIGDGEFIPLPPVAGYLVLEIGAGIHQFDYRRQAKNIFQYCRWIAYKNPTITLTDRNYKDIELEDIEDSAWLNTSAKETLEINTILGTSGEALPNAKGQLYDSSGNVYTQFIRNGVTARLERLLIATAYSQYADRHNCLSGEVVLLPSFGIYGDANTNGKFILASEVQKCIDDVSDIEMIAFGADEYQGVES